MNIPEQSKEILLKLLRGNQQFINGKYEAKNITIETLRCLADYQNPHACVLSCSDSRIVPELIFEAGIGELFVIRVAGITIGPNIMESIEYAVKKLNVPLLILLGHDNCGVMEYAQEHYPCVGENFKTILNCVYPAIEVDKTALKSENVLARQHTLWVEEYILAHSKIISEAVKNKELYIAKCHLSHKTGEVLLLDSTLHEVLIKDI